MERVCGNYLNYTLSSVLGCLLAFLPLISNKFNDWDGVMPIFLTSIISAFVLIYWLCCRDSKNAKVCVNIVDISFILYICYGFFRIVISETIFNPIIVCEWFGLAIIYVIVRVLESKFLKVLYLSLFIGGTIQAIIGIFQYADLLGSNNLNFKITGSFFNPGHYGGFLALSFIVGIFIWREKKFSVSKGNIFLPCTLLIQTFALFLSNSRAAWIAVTVPLGFLFVNNYFNRPFYQHWCVKFSLFILTVIMVVSLYYYKKASADVRVLTWNSSLLMIKDALVFGHGIGSFAANYMPYQARYLDEHTGENCTLIADNNMIAFNELIHATCEQGIVGLLLLISLLVYAWYGSRNTKYQLGARLGLMSLFMFALFSYPAAIFPIKVCFPLFIGILGKDRKPIIEFILKKAMIVFLIGIIGMGIFYNAKSYTMYSNAYNSLRGGIHVRDISNYSSMRHNKNFLYLLSQQYLKHDQINESIQVKELLLDIAPSSSLLCDLGMLYLYKQELDSARACFLYAKRMTPNHISPAYGLWLVNRTEGNKEECIRLSEEIIAMPVRVVNNVVLKARKEARDYIQKQEK